MFTQKHTTRGRGVMVCSSLMHRTGIASAVAIAAMSIAGMSGCNNGLSGGLLGAGLGAGAGAIAGS
ncbi:MAG: hypothetical protein H7210_05305, partial [Pyrinomonadaceae bacterium]|nr:hypothetical protein [Phycisphaerales bacterium]